MEADYTGHKLLNSLLRSICYNCAVAKIKIGSLIEGDTHAWDGDVSSELSY